MSEDFKLLYEELYERPLAEPTCEEDVRNILSCIRTQHGHFDDHEEAELQSASAILRKKVRLLANGSRKILAQFTKA